MRKLEITFTVAKIPDLIAEEKIITAQEKAKEAFVMDLLRHAEISAGYAAEMLEIDRGKLSNLMREYKISPFDETITVEGLQHEVTEVIKILEKKN
ncbi:MAG: UPF0175 family protein [Cyanobacteriota bacterium]|nr:UPF0175 family protein [Cyanobacteriota bacterium]